MAGCPSWRGVIPSPRVILSGAKDLQSNPVHVVNAMKDLYDMGDAPSCHTCGAIMVRNGSCYRCMSCGSTSGCS
jgi:ribonucleoside-diphosphate reductase alpha chain